MFFTSYVKTSFLAQLVEHLTCNQKAVKECGFVPRERITFRVVRFDEIVVLTAHPGDAVRYLLSLILRKPYT